MSNIDTLTETALVVFVESELYKHLNSLRYLAERCIINNNHDFIGNMFLMEMLL